MITDYKIWKTSKLLPKKDRISLKKYSPLEIEECFALNLGFGTGGLRGIMGLGTNRINDFTIKQTTMGLASYIISKYQAPQHVVIAYDTRLNSKHYATISAQTLAHYGIIVHLFINPRPTPQLSFMVRHLHAQAGIVITASHNPPIYNGFKIYDHDGCQFVPHLVDEIRQFMERDGDYFAFSLPSYTNCKKRGLIKELGARDDQPYLSFLKKLRIRKTRKSNFHIVYTPLHGTGIAYGTKLLEQLGYQVSAVDEQMVIDHNFSTLSSPNPENKSAFILAEKLGHAKNAALLMATDPDADRLGVAIKEENEYRYLSGSELGALMLNYLLKFKPRTPASTLITTIVTPPLGKKMAQAHGLTVIETLTGFKYIGEQIAKLPQPTDFFFGYEESFGYLFSPLVRDKDAFQAMILCAELFNYYFQRNISVTQALTKIHRKYGYYADCLENYEFAGLKGLDIMANVMTSVRQKARNIITHGLKLVAIEDYQSSLRTDDLGNTETITMPKSDVIKIIYSLGSIVFRPSGTEPKLKIYLSFKGQTLERARAILNQVRDTIVAFIAPYQTNG